VAVNRAYMLIDDLSCHHIVAAPSPARRWTWMRPPVQLTSTDNVCSQSCGDGRRGQARLALQPQRRHRRTGVTSSLIFGGLVFFSTNRPVDVAAGACQTTWASARLRGQPADGLWRGRHRGAVRRAPLGRLHRRRPAALAGDGRGAGGTGGRSR
jgi:hypothetical protein